MASGIPKLYVDGDTGNDSNDGTSWAEAKLTMEAAFDLVPGTGWCDLYVKGYGASKLEPARTYWPFGGYRGHLRIIGCDDWEVVATGQITGYSLMSGRQSWDEYTIAWDGGYVADDVTDRKLWVEFEDDTAATFLRKIMALNTATGNYEIPNQWGFPAITTPLPIRLVRPRTQIHPTSYMRVGSSSAPELGSVAMASVEFKPSGMNGAWGVGTAAVYVDATSHGRAFGLQQDGVLGGMNITAVGMGTGYEYLYFQASSLVDTPMEGKLSNYYLPGSHLEMDGTGSALCTLTGGPLGNRVFWSTYDGGRFEVWNGTQVIPFHFRGGGDLAHWNVYTRSTSSLAYCLVDGDLVVGEDSFMLVGNTIEAGGIDVRGGELRSSGGGIDTVILSRSAPTDQVCVKAERGSRINFIRFEGGWDLATPGIPLPAVELAGDVAELDIDLDNMDRGDGPVTLVKDGARAQLLEVKGDNTNAGGGGTCVGLQIEDPAFVEVDVSEATATGADGDVKVGSLAAQVWPGAGNRVNDVSNPPANTDHLAQLKTI